jgi:hypothetical protein
VPFRVFGGKKAFEPFRVFRGKKSFCGFRVFRGKKSRVDGKEKRIFYFLGACHTPR